MERTKFSPLVTVAHDLGWKRLKIDVKLPDVDEKNIALDLKKDSFCIDAQKEDVEFQGCFLLNHDIDPERTETKYENGVFSIFTPYKEWEYWDSLREGYMGRPVVRG
jgi:HSP20 family molecular chaperone IbpA